MAKITKRNLVFLGAPGAGKGTLADILSQDTGMAHISTGDILRAEIEKGTELGKKAKQFVTSGGLVPDELVADMVGSRLKEKDCAKGFILDGFPRTVKQADLLDAVMRKIGVKLDKVVYFEVDEDLLIKRLTARIVCKKCKSNYNTMFSPPKKADVCDNCGGPLIHREDDTLEKAQYRLKVYNEQTAPLIPYYKTRGMLSVINGGQPKDKSYPELLEVLA